MKIGSEVLSNGTLRKTFLALRGTTGDAQPALRRRPSWAITRSTRRLEVGLSLRLRLIAAGEATGTVNMTFPRIPATYTMTWLPTFGLLLDAADRFIQTSSEPGTPTCSALPVLYVPRGNSALVELARGVTRRQPWLHPPEGKTRRATSGLPSSSFPLGLLSSWPARHPSPAAIPSALPSSLRRSPSPLRARPESPRGVLSRRDRPC